ncbi:MAG: nuclear transport factor 2 family protein [Eubacterium sp.]|nr:nuclear transport factor 2 family protein [Eubacterium sp.]
MLKTPLENEVTDYYRSVYKSVIDEDLDVLSEVLDEGFVFTKLSGEEQDRETFFEELRSEALNVYSENVERIYVKNEGDTLNVRGRSKINVSIDGSKRRIKKIQLDLVLKKTSEGEDPDTGELRPELTKWRVMSAKAAIY